MTSRVLLATITLALAATPAHADSDTTGGSTSTPTPGRGRHGGGQRAAKKSDGGAAKPGQIRGHCTLLASSDNPISGPCVNLMLLVNDSKGNEVDRERTTESGDFELNVDPKADANGQFRIQSGSRFYDVAAPTDVVHSGQRVDVSLKNK